LLGRVKTGRISDDLDLGQYTMNGKKVEIAVTTIVSGSQFVPSATIANPGSLESYYKYLHIEKFAQPPREANGRANL
jgi:hypothetical protein